MSDRRPPAISRRVGKLRGDRLALGVLIAAATILGARAWLADNPQHNPWTPLDLNDPPGWATRAKLVALKDDKAECRAVLERSGVAFDVLDPAGEGACKRSDRTIMSDQPLSPAPPPTTCAIGVGMELWLRDVVQPAARQAFGNEVARVEHYGAFSCRRLYGRAEGRWSEHATGNAIDIAAFVLADGTRISILADWNGDPAASAFLKAVRDGACPLFATVLSPDYNEAHRDHLHFDQAARYSGVCR